MEKVKVLKLSEITENTSKLVEIEDKKIAVFNVDGEIYAIDDTCSHAEACLLYTSPSPRDRTRSRMPSSA